MPGVFFHTLGCKSNQYEETRMAEGFARYGLARVDDPALATVIVVNSCCVTVTAEGKSRRLARRLKRDHPRALVVLAGCLASILPANPEFVDLAVPQERKESLPDLVAGGRLGLPRVHAPALPGQNLTRALLKVQDGCDRCCTYCIIPVIRGGEVSAPLPELLAETARLAEAGFREIVLTGMVTGRYASEGRDLAGLIAAMLEFPGFRVRISSIDPRDVTDPLLDLAAGHPRVCRHLHIPLQSGGARILERMNRRYGPELFAGRVRALLDRDPLASVTSDVICGFPGEGEKDFRETLDLLGDLPLYDFHVFPFSPRPGTPAAGMTGQVPEGVKRERVERLLALKAEKRSEHMARCLGTIVEVLVETAGPPTGTADNYLEVALPGCAAAPGALVRARLHAIEDDLMIGEAVT